MTKRRVPVNSGRFEKQIILDLIHKSQERWEKNIEDVKKEVVEKVNLWRKQVVATEVSDYESALAACIRPPYEVHVPPSPYDSPYRNATQQLSYLQVRESQVTAMADEDGMIVLNMNDGLWQLVNPSE